MQVRYLGRQTCDDGIAAMPPIVWAIPIAVGGILFLLITCAANREIERAVDDQVAQQEGEFCMKLGQLPGTQYETCVQEAAKLTTGVRELRLNESP